MSSFIALNIEPQEDSEDDIDDSKEIQIEDALKLYQNALKLHSQGPAYYREAEAAYQALFDSDIFTYPESLSLSKQIDLYGEVDELNDASRVLDSGAVELQVTAADEAPNTLHQILYLAYKNRGLYLLDWLKNQLQLVRKGRLTMDNSTLLKVVQDTVVASLHSFVEAADRDDADLHLWRLIAKLSYFLGSKRLARFCLEAVLDTNDADYGGWPASLGLEESFAAEQLRTLLHELGDIVSKNQIATVVGNKTGLLPSLKKHIDPYPFLPPPSDDTKSQHSLSSLYESLPDRQEISVSVRSWTSVGKAILLLITNLSQGAVESTSGAAYTLRIPSRQVPLENNDSKANSEVVELRRRSSTKETASKHSTPYASDKEVKEEVFKETCAPDTTDKAYDVEASEVLNTSEIVAEPSEESCQRSADDETTAGTSGSNVATISRVDAPEPLILESPRTMSLPTRKRSSEAAGLPETADLGRSKSKRIKARVSVNETAAEDLSQFYEDQLRENTQADQVLFDFVGDLLSRLDANHLRTLDELKRSLKSSSHDAILIDASEDPLGIPIRDLKSALAAWSVDKSTAFLKASSHADAFGGSNGARNLIAFLENSKRGPSQISNLQSLPEDEGLETFVHLVDRGWFLLDQLAFAWVQELLVPKVLHPDHGSQITSTYEHYAWTSSLKETVVQLLVQKDEYTYTVLNEQLDGLDQRILTANQKSDIHPWGAQDETLVRLIQNIFEIHIDVYERITNPSSEVDFDIRAMQRDRLSRWAALAHQALNQRPQTEPEPDFLSMRFLWSTVLFVNLTDASARDHVIMCFQDLKRILVASGNPTIRLENNAAMPEISAEAADREISCLTTMDFFLGIFNAGNDEPISVIESLEPILQKSILEKGISRQTETEGSRVRRMRDDATSPSAFGNTDAHCLGTQRAQIDDVVQYFNKASFTLKLFLWQRLGNAYEAIGYPPQVLACNFRRMEIIVEYLQNAEYGSLPAQARQLRLLVWLNELENLITRTLNIALSNTDAFEVVDMMLLRTSMATMSALQRVIHTYILWTDSVRVGQNTVSQHPRGSAATQFAASMAKFDQLQVITWMLQFLLLKESILQAPELFQEPSDDLIDYLNLVHYTLGLRELCGLCSKKFLRLMKTEMLVYRASGKASDSWEWDFAQVIFDMHGIKICPSFANIRDHGCTPEVVDRATALELMEYVIVQANRLSVRDLVKSELKPTIDRMQQAIKAPKSSNVTSLNKRAISHYLRSPINPLDMYRALRGIGELSAVPIENHFSEIADKGWYFLLGHISLARFRSQKRTIPGPLDDLDLAMTFFRHDLELGMEKWETWYRLAQVYDTRIEENTTWNAERINNGMEELKLLQRSAIHCYVMAVAIATRSADASFEAVSKMADLYADFAIRIYASSREPFSMKAFGLQEFERHFSNPHQGMYKRRPFRDLQLYPAWNFASVLLQRALADKSNSWMSWYMLGKCFWKMYNCSEDVRGNAKPPEYGDVIDAFKRAIKAVPDRRDARHPEKEPILEPHYKLVSVVHKLVQKGEIQVSEACSCLKDTSYARKVPSVDDQDDWEMYISQVLKALRSADKSNWHHRMLARVRLRFESEYSIADIQEAAHVIYDDSPNDVRSALGAKHELTQQMFTKTMAIQVWRPDNERAGRHFVYTSRYVKFFVRLLFQLNDRASLEALAKRIRKRSGDFLAHAEIWQEVCLTYLELLRRQIPVPAEHENTVFRNILHGEFILKAERLEAWAHLPDTTSPLLDIIKDTIELKKTNSNLMKASVIEDLIGDTYALLYEQIIPDLIAKSNDEESRVRMRVNHVLMDPEASATATPPPDPNARAGEITSARPRFRGVTKRELQRRAEGLIVKPAAALAAAKVAKPMGPVSEQSGVTAVAVLIGKEAPARDGASSVAGSVHDSADDESELSELEEFVDAPEKPPALFPNLTTKSGEAEEEDEGDEGGNEDQERDEEGDEVEDGADEKEDEQEGFHSPAGQEGKGLGDDDREEGAERMDEDCRASYA